MQPSTFNIWLIVTFLALTRSEIWSSLAGWLLSPSRKAAKLPESGAEPSSPDLTTFFSILPLHASESSPPPPAKPRLGFSPPPHPTLLSSSPSRNAAAGAAADGTPRRRAAAGLPDAAARLRGAPRRRAPPHAAPSPPAGRDRRLLRRRRRGSSRVRQPRDRVPRRARGAALLPGAPHAGGAACRR